MAGDYSRNSFDSLRDFSGLFFQQGHPTLDSDWNEWVELVDRRMCAETVDTIGRATVPRETPAGFAITAAAGPTLTIGRGRIYVDGLLAECHGTINATNPPAFDRERIAAGRAVGVLDEAISAAAGDTVDYLAQPYWPTPDPLPAKNGPHLAYLDVWRREVTTIKDPRLLDPAMGGIDTATRWQTVWQVRLLPDIGAGATCGSDINAWDTLIAPSPARLTTATVEFEDPDEPCLIPPGGGYRGLENQLYRVEIHSGGGLGAARFKWSRDNGSVGSSVESFTDGSRLTVRRIGRDTVLRFETGDWVEVTDDRREFARRSGDMRRVTVEPDTNELRFDTPLSADLVPSGVGGDTAAARHSRVVKWDQAGQVLLPDGTVWADLDGAGADGLIPVPADGRAVMLEAGITVSFTTIDAGRDFRAEDYWIFAARTEGAQIEELNAAPPEGIHHHYSRLGVVTFPSTVVDCRTLWPPLVEGDTGCGCTVCVSAEEHNSGALTIQQAISQLPAEGGTVCLSPGDFQLGATPVVISGRRSTRLKGHGGATQLSFVGTGAAIEVTGATDVRISDLTIGALAVRDGAGEANAIRLRNLVGGAVERVGAAAIVTGDGIGTAIGLDGFLFDVAIDDCALTGTIGVGVTRKGEGTAGYVALLETRITRSTIIALRTGIQLTGTVFHLGAVDIAENLIFAAEAGIAANGVGLAAANAAAVTNIAGAAVSAVPAPTWSSAALRITANAIGVSRSGDGILSAVPDTRIADNEIASGGNATGNRPGSAIRLLPGRLAQPRVDVQLTGNRLGHFDGAGISVEGPVATIIAKRNVIRDCGLGGFVMTDKAAADLVSFDNNHVERVGLSNIAAGQAAVRLVATSDARVLGNHIETVGSAVATGDVAVDYWAGIELNGVLSADIAHNLITAIGDGQVRGTAVGILCDGSVISGSIGYNHIFDQREADRADSLGWAGIFMRPLGKPATNDAVTINNAASDNRFLRVAGRLLAFSTVGIKDLGPTTETTILITDNRIEDAHPRSRLPLVRASVMGDDQSSLRFGGNQCRLSTPGAVPAIVQIGAHRVDASHNMVRRGGDALALQILCDGADKRPTAIVIGNITMGNIQINGAPVPAPFDVLNILA